MLARPLSYRRLVVALFACGFTVILLLNNANDVAPKPARVEVKLLFPPFTKRLLGRTENTYTNPLINKNKNLIFCWIPKVACSQFKGMLALVSLCAYCHCS